MRKISPEAQKPRSSDRKLNLMICGFVYFPGFLGLVFTTMIAVAPSTVSCMLSGVCPTPYNQVLATGVTACNCPPMSPPDPVIFGVVWFQEWYSTGNVISVQGTQCCQLGGTGSKAYQLKLSDVDVPVGVCSTGYIRLTATGDSWPSPNPTCPNNAVGTYGQLEYISVSEGPCP